MKGNTICIIMGGGRGTRLHPLTKDRCKPAVPLAGKYRLVDIPISNCLNSGLNRIYLLSQFNTASLHRHIQDSYKFDPFGGGFVDILSAEQTEAGDTWYQGTADAVRQNLIHLGGVTERDRVVILSGDQLYRMDLRLILAQHEKTAADVTVAAKPIPVSDVLGLGLMRVTDDLSISEFVEKPKDPKIIAGLAISENVRLKMNEPQDVDYCLASMGIYVFNGKVLREALDSPYTDFGGEVIPKLLGKVRLMSYIFDDYWEDIGTVRAFFEANLRLTDPIPPFNFFDESAKVFTHARFLPASKINRARLDRAIIADGCILNDCDIEHAVVGVRSVVSKGASLKNVVMMGADHFEDLAEIEDNERLNRPSIGIGPNSVIEDAIIDKNVRIGANVKLSPKGKPDGFQEGAVVIRDGVLVVHKNGIVPDNTVI